MGRFYVSSLLYDGLQHSGSSFNIQISLMLYMVPAFVYCLLFTNLEPRFLITIYESTMDNGVNIRQAICKFNLFHYGSLLAIYPIILLTNFNWILFIGKNIIMQAWAASSFLKYTQTVYPITVQILLQSITLNISSADSLS